MARAKSTTQHTKCCYKLPSQPLDATRDPHITSKLTMCTVSLVYSQWQCQEVCQEQADQLWSILANKCQARMGSEATPLAHTSQTVPCDAQDTSWHCGRLICCQCQMATAKAQCTIHSPIYGGPKWLMVVKNG